MDVPENLEEEWSLLANAIAEPVQQIIAVETASYDQMMKVVSWLGRLAESRTIILNDIDQYQFPKGVWYQIAERVNGIRNHSELPIYVLVMRFWQQYEDAEAQQGWAEFWRGMNHLREKWHEIPAQVVFLLSPVAYEQLTLNADQLKSWIALKVRLWEGARDISELARSGVRWLSPPPPLLPKSSALDEIARREQMKIIARQFEQALERGETEAILTDRYLLRLVAGYLALSEKDQAMYWMSRIPSSQKSRESVVDKLRSFEKRLAAFVEPQFDVFLSHNSKDKPIVIALAERLKAHGLKVWLDVWELRPGHPWQEALEEIIETTRSAAVLAGENELGSWQGREMRACLSEFVKRGLPVIPVLLPGCRIVPKLPFFLSQFTWVDLRAGLTDEGIKRLVWGITGVKPP